MVLQRSRISGRERAMATCKDCLHFDVCLLCREEAEKALKDRERKMRGNEILLVYICRQIFGLRKRFFKTRVKS